MLAKPLSPIQKLILVVLDDFAGIDGEAYPSLSTLADRCCVSLSAIKSNLNDLEAAGLIVRDRRHRQATHYRINYHAITDSGSGLVRQTDSGRPPEGQPRPPSGFNVGRQKANGRPPSGHQPVIETDKEKRSRKQDACAADAASPAPPKREGSKRGKKHAEYTPEFEGFWQAYPAKVRTGKQDAFRAWVKVLSHLNGSRPDAAAWLAQRARDLAASPKASGPYVPRPSTFLNGGRYDDDPAAWQDSGIERTNGQAQPPEDLEAYAAQIQQQLDDEKATRRRMMGLAP